MILRLLPPILLLLLSACATTPPLTPETSAPRLMAWQAHQQQLRQIAHWRAQGRAAILAQGAGGQIAFDWQSEPGQRLLHIRTPLGQNAMQLTQNSQGVVLVDQEGRVYEGEEAEELLHETLGWAVPFDAMHAWLLGLPASEEETFRLDAEGRLERLQSGDWRIEYQAYTVVDGIALPRRLELVHRHLTLRLIVDRWQL